MPNAARSSSAMKRATVSEADTILRFHASERHLHWAIAIPFLVCYSTAVILVAVYNQNPALPFRHLVSITHRISGLCLFALPLWTAVRHRHDVALYLHNVRQAWTWTPDDVKWLLLIGPASLSRKVGLPHQGKFNAGEKINFIALTCTYPLYILTGLIIWFGGVPYLSWLAHFSLAAIATPLIFGHILMATVNPDTRPGLMGMISGLVDREWAKHHYHHWYHEHHGRGAVVPQPVIDVMPEAPATSWVHARGSVLGAALFDRPAAGAGTEPVRGAADKRLGARAILAGLEADARAVVSRGEVDASAAS